MSSPGKYYNIPRITFGGHSMKNLHSSVAWANLLAQDKELLDVTTVPAGCDGRPDLMSDLLFGTPNLWWAICAVNNITNPLTDFDSGKVIYIPKV